MAIRYIDEPGDNITCYQVIRQKYCYVRYQPKGTNGYIEIPGGVRYELDSNQGKCPDVEYDVTVNLVIRRSNDCVLILDRVLTYRLKGIILGLRFVYLKPYTGQYECGKWAGLVDEVGFYQVYSDLEHKTIISGAAHSSSFAVDDNVTGAKILDIQRVDGEPDNCQPCTLKAFDVDNNEIFTQNFDECPDVVAAGCIDELVECLGIKIPFLGQVIMRNTATNWDESNVQDLPPECAELYKLIPSIPIGGGLGSTAQPIWDFIEYYCSDEACERPRISRVACVICEPEQDECPPGSCQIVCDGVVCCYDQQGNLITSFPL